MTLLRPLIVLLFCSPAVFGQSKSKSIIGTYSGYWGDSRWTYVFNNDNSFRFSTTGHVGFTSTIGEFQLFRDTILLISFPKDKQSDSSFITLKDKLLIDGDSCIIDLTFGYDYCRENPDKQFIHRSRKRIKIKEVTRKRQN